MSWPVSLYIIICTTIMYAVAINFAKERKAFAKALAQRTQERDRVILAYGRLRARFEKATGESGMDPEEEAGVGSIPGIILSVAGPDELQQTCDRCKRLRAASSMVHMLEPLGGFKMDRDFHGGLVCGFCRIDLTEDLGHLEFKGMRGYDMDTPKR